MLRSFSSIVRASPLSRRFVHSTSALSTPNHTPDSYAKDVDATPPPDSKIHRVDPHSEHAQKPYEPPSGQWSKAGVQTDQYQTMSKDQPYAAPGEDRRYGGKEQYAKDKGPETSQPGSGPEGAESEGRKPEGR